MPNAASRPAAPRANTHTTWRVAIADDEPAARRGVRQLLEPYEAFTVVAECRDGAETLRVLSGGDVDVLFLDIQMPEVGGLDVLRARGGERPAVVMLTAYDQFAVQAFELEALDYLVKPVSERRFRTTIERLSRRLTQPRSGSRSTLVVETSRGTVVLDSADVDWIESADNYVRIWVGTKAYLLRQALSELEREMEAAGFQRAHRRALVRMTAVRELVTTTDGMLARLRSGAEVPVSRRRRAAFAAAVRGRVGTDRA